MRHSDSRWRPTWARYLPAERALAIFILVLAVVVAILLRYLATPVQQSSTFQCAPDGSLIFPYAKFHPSWSVDYFFSITLAWGEFGLSTVKIIDVCFDLVVGRGGQFLLSALIFTTIRKSIVTAPKKRPWRLPVLTRLTLDPVSFLGWWTMVKSLCTRGPLRVLGFVLVATYVLAFSTVVSAMSGYRSRMDPFYPQEGGGTLPLGVANQSDLYLLQLWNAMDPNKWLSSGTTSCALDIHPDMPCFSQAFAGHGCVVPPGSECFDAFERYQELIESCGTMLGHGKAVSSYDALPTPNPTSSARSVTFLNATIPFATVGPSTATLDLVKPYTTTVASTPTTTWAPIRVPPDTVILSAEHANIIERGSCKTYDDGPPLFVDWAAYDNGRFYLTTSNMTIQNRTFVIGAPPLVVGHFGYDDTAEAAGLPSYYRVGDSGAVLNSTWLRANAVCQPAKTYQWGFSALMLFTLAIVTIAFAAILLLLSGGRRLHPNYDGPPPSFFSVYRDVMDLSAEIRHEVGDDDAMKAPARSLHAQATAAGGTLRSGRGSGAAADPEDKRSASPVAGAEATLLLYHHAEGHK